MKKENQEQGTCPKCGEGTLSYEEIEVTGNSVYYPYTCESCGLNGKEWYDIEFTEHTDTSGEAIQWDVNFEHKIPITLDSSDFFTSMGRLPNSEDEFDTWAGLVEKCLLNGHIDWDIVYQCTKEIIQGESKNG